MKKALFLFLLPLCFTACTSSTPDTTVAANKDSLATPPVPLPYTAIYSSNFVPGKQIDVLTVLNNYKDWEINDMKAMRTTMGDTVEFIFSGGTRIKNSGDSVLRLVTKYRDSLSMVNLTIFAWTSNHSVDKNSDWVNVWYKEIDTYKTGKVDSVLYEDDNMLLDGKIVYTSSHTQKLKK